MLIALIVVAVIVAAVAVPIAVLLWRFDRIGKYARRIGPKRSVEVLVALAGENPSWPKIRRIIAN